MYALLHLKECLLEHMFRHFAIYISNQRLIIGIRVNSQTMTPSYYASHVCTYDTESESDT